MPSTSKHALQLSHPATGTVSRARKQFNTLVKKLGTARSALAEWKEILPLVATKADRDYWPLVESHRERLQQLMVLLDEMHGNKALGKRERDKLSKFVASTVYELLAEADDEVLKDIYNRHSGIDFDAEEEGAKDEVRQMLGELLGTEFTGEIDLRSPESVLRTLEDQFDEKAGFGPHDSPRAPKRAAGLARERREAAEAQRVQQSMRDIFRTLASQLHPDRESDESERLRKTALMQRVNAAYAAKDMLGLLELQLETEQIDPANVASLSDERIRQYNKVLSEQLAELQHEIAGVEQLAALEMGMDLFAKVTPAAMLQTLDRDIAQLRESIAMMVDDLQTFRDVRMLKAWLKALPKAAAKPQLDDDLFW